LDHEVFAAEIARLKKYPVDPHLEQIAQSTRRYSGFFSGTGNYIINSISLRYWQEAKIEIHFSIRFQSHALL
jgi:hypothetical protein